jgi:Plant PDR ABC transporter associated
MAKGNTITKIKEKQKGQGNILPYTVDPYISYLTLFPHQNQMQSSNETIGTRTLISRGLNYAGYYYWIGVGALIGFIILFNFGFTLCLTFKRRTTLLIHRNFLIDQSLICVTTSAWQLIITK